MRASFARWVETLRARPELLSGEPAAGRATARLDAVGRALVANQATEARLGICRGCEHYVPAAGWGSCRLIEGCCGVFVARVRAGKCPVVKFGLRAEATAG